MKCEMVSWCEWRSLNINSGQFLGRSHWKLLLRSPTCWTLTLKCLMWAASSVSLLRGSSLQSWAAYWSEKGWLWTSQWSCPQSHLCLTVHKISHTFLIGKQLPHAACRMYLSQVKCTCRLCRVHVTSRPRDGIKLALPEFAALYSVVAPFGLRGMLSMLLSVPRWGRVKPRDPIGVECRWGHAHNKCYKQYKWKLV